MDKFDGQVLGSISVVRETKEQIEMIVEHQIEQDQDIKELQE